MPNPLKLVAPAGLLGLAACASVPTGPSVMVLPGTGKNFDQFRVDDAACRQFAYVQAGGKTPTQAATAGSGAATGAGTGTGEAATSAGTAQERYDIGYIQCMYSKGNRVPVPGNVLYQDRRGSYPPPPPPSGGSSTVPPSPAGTGSSP